MLDDLRNYLQLASGLTEATASKAKDAVTGLLAHGVSLSSKALPAPEMMGQVQELADDLVATSRNNREMLVGMIRAEVDRNVGRMGFVREDELAALRRHVQRLEKQIADVQQDLSAAQAQAGADPAGADVPGADVPGADVPGADVPGATPPRRRHRGRHRDGGRGWLHVAEDAAPEVPKKKKKKIVVDPGA